MGTIVSKKIISFLALVGLASFTVPFLKNHKVEDLVNSNSLYRLESIGFVLPAEAEDGEGGNVTCITEGGACVGSCGF